MYDSLKEWIKKYAPRTKDGKFYVLTQEVLERLSQAQAELIYQATQDGELLLHQNDQGTFVLLRRGEESKQTKVEVVLPSDKKEKDEDIKDGSDDDGVGEPESVVVEEDAKVVESTTMYEMATPEDQVYFNDGRGNVVVVDDQPSWKSLVMVFLSLLVLLVSVVLLVFVFITDIYYIQNLVILGLSTATGGVGFFLALRSWQNNISAKEARHVLDLMHQQQGSVQPKDVSDDGE